MLDGNGDGMIDDASLQKKLFNARAHMVLNCMSTSNNCNADNNKNLMMTFAEKMGRCSDTATCKDQVYNYMAVPSNYDNDAKKREFFVRRVLNGFAGVAHSLDSTPSFFNAPALSSMSVADTCEGTDCINTSSITLTQMVIDGAFASQADCEDAISEFGWGDSSNLAFPVPNLLLRNSCEPCSAGTSFHRTSVTEH